MLNTKTRANPVVIGALGATCLLTEYLALIVIGVMMTRKGDRIQQTAVVQGSAHILRKVLFIPA